MKKIVIYLFLVSFGLSGCSIYRTYQRPEAITAMADSLYVGSGDTTSIATLSWRQLFTDPLLQQLIEMGIQNNTDLSGKEALFEVTINGIYQ